MVGLCAPQGGGVLIELGERWAAEERTVFHACGPDVRTPWIDDGPACACGTLVPRRVRSFRDWLRAADRPDLSALLEDA